MPRNPRVQQSVFPYHITTKTAGQFFAFNKETYKIIIGVLVAALKLYPFQLHHFKMMHTHYHMIISTPHSNISKIMWFINNMIAKKINELMDRKGHLWASRFRSSIIDTNEYLGNAIGYIYLNGVRAKICMTAAEDKQLSTFEFYANGKKIDFDVVEDCVYLMWGSTPEIRQATFMSIFSAPRNEEEILAIRNGLRKIFYGSADFIKFMKSMYLPKKK